MTTTRMLWRSAGPALCLAMTTAIAAPPPPGFTDPPPDDAEVNDTFSQRTILPGSSACKWTGRFSGRLGDYDSRFPRTRVCFTAFAGEFCTAEQDADVLPTVYQDYGLFF
ncbi:MAG: hypothetical protein VYC34_06770, partial [Planctomycetota bacterium]|nr:hypothetical protein [Planctomycetota bacterium]